MSARPPHPGELLATVLAQLGDMSARELAQRIRTAPGTVTRILNAQGPMTPRVARRIHEAVGGPTPAAWLRVQAAFTAWEEEAQGGGEQLDVLSPGQGRLRDLREVLRPAVRPAPEPPQDPCGEFAAGIESLDVRHGTAVLRLDADWTVPAVFLDPGMLAPQGMLRRAFALGRPVPLRARAVRGADGSLRCLLVEGVLEPRRAG